MDEDTGVYVDGEQCEDQNSDGWKILFVVGAVIAATIYYLDKEGGV